MLRVKKFAQFLLKWLEKRQICWSVSIILSIHPILAQIKAPLTPKILESGSKEAQTIEKNRPIWSHWDKKSETKILISTESVRNDNQMKKVRQSLKATIRLQQTFDTSNRLSISALNGAKNSFITKYRSQSFYFQSSLIRRSTKPERNVPLVETIFCDFGCLGFFLKVSLRTKIWPNIHDFAKLV